MFIADDRQFWELDSDYIDEMITLARAYIPEKMVLSDFCNSISWIADLDALHFWGA